MLAKKYFFVYIKRDDTEVPPNKRNKNGKHPIAKTENIKRSLSVRTMDL